MLPANRPQQSREETDQILRAHGISDGFGLLGVRGYFKKTMGDPAKNDRGIYDDAIMLLTPTAYETFNANVDPSVTRHGIAVLKPGVYRYKIGIHGLSKPPAKRYKALVQASGVNLIRDGGKEETNVFRGINIHKGYNTTTGSEGCQTIPQAGGQWDSFIALVEAEIERHGRKDIPYVLIAHA